MESGTGEGFLQGGAGKESPSHGFAVPAPFRQGGRGDGGCGLPGQYVQQRDGGVRAPRPTGGTRGAVERGVIFASIYITEKEGDFGQFKGKFFIFVGCDSFSALNLVDMTVVSGSQAEKGGTPMRAAGDCRKTLRVFPTKGLPLDFRKKISASKAGSILPYYDCGDNARKNLPEGKFCHIL